MCVFRICHMGFGIGGRVVTVVWKRSAIIAAGKRGRARAKLAAGWSQVAYDSVAGTGPLAGAAGYP
jgi:hypothetical protein